jgi:16S rRNA (guanine527-N7)-methyltransferase
MKFEAKKNKALSQIKNFYSLTNSQIKSLEDFVVFLLQENQKFNFIGESTVKDLWERHILDSAQLINFIENKDSKFIDFGSGAGFPGIVLSIMGLKEIHLVEKSFRKSEFLRHAKLFSVNKIFIHQIKLEDLLDKKFDCIISRAFAPLEKLLSYSQNFLNQNGYCLFLKGKNLPLEIAEAQKKFKFSFELHQSLTSSESNIIKISNITSIC